MFYRETYLFREVINNAWLTMSRMTNPLTVNPEPLSLYERRVYKTRNPQIVLKMNLNVSPGLKNSITKQANYERIKIAHVLNSKWYQHGMWWGWKHAFPFIFLLYLYFLAAIDDPNHTQKLDIPYRFGQRSLYSFQTIGRFAFLRKRNASNIEFSEKPEVVMYPFHRSFGFVFSPLCSRANVCARVRLFFFI